MFLDEPIHESVLLRDLLTRSMRTEEIFLELGSGAWSTPIFSKIAQEIGARFITVDASPATAAWARQELKGFPRSSALHARAEEVIGGLEGDVGFVYMDNYDWVDSGEPGSERYGRNLSKRESELVHLEQAIRLLPKLSAQAVILFDDTWMLEKDPPASRNLRERPDLSSLTNESLLTHYDIFGKGSLAVPFLLGQGFRITAGSERPNATQLLLQRDPTGRGICRWDRAFFEWLIQQHRQVGYATPMPDKLVAPLVVLKQHAMGIRSTLRVRTRARSLLARLRPGSH